MFDFQKVLSTALILALFTIAAPYSGAEPGPAKQKTQLDDKAEAAFKKANKAVSSLRSLLMARVKQALKKGGPPAAIQVCSQQAFTLAERVAKRYEVKIGRTSRRLRNPKNKAPQWMDSILKREADLTGPQRAETDSVYGIAFPITTGQACLRCHGQKSSFTPQLVQTIENLYPADAATGFKKGDRRGWFWVEVAKDK